MAKLVIAHGCSFTKYKWTCWPDMLPWFDPSVSVKNKGAAGSPNETISRGVVNSVLKHENIHHMYVMWSGANRYEVVQDKINEDLKKEETITYSRWDPDFQWNIFYGGHYYSRKHDFYTRWFLNENQNYVRTLENILYTQMFLDKKNIPYTMMVYRGHIINHNKNDMSNGEMALYNQINWNKFKFYKENLGLDEYTRECVPEAFIEKKDLHPLPLAHYKFLKYIVLQSDRSASKNDLKILIDFPSTLEKK